MCERLDKLLLPSLRQLPNLIYYYLFIIYIYIYIYIISNKCIYGYSIIIKFNNVIMCTSNNKL